MARSELLNYTPSIGVCISDMSVSIPESLGRTLFRSCLYLASDGFAFAVSSDAVVVGWFGWFLLWSWGANTEAYAH